MKYLSLSISIHPTHIYFLLMHQHECQVEDPAWQNPDDPCIPRIRTSSTRHARPNFGTKRLIYKMTKKRGKAKPRVLANHLLNFSLPERPAPPPIRKKKASLPSRTREDFLQAKYVMVDDDHGVDEGCKIEPNLHVAFDLLFFRIKMDMIFLLFLTQMRL